MYNRELSSLRAPICSICNSPVPLNNAKTDEDGSAIHETCYLVKIGVTKSVSRHLKVSSTRLLEIPRQKRHSGD
jgi:hypothetical protein